MHDISTNKEIFLEDFSSKSEAFASELLDNIIIGFKY